MLRITFSFVLSQVFVGGLSRDMDSRCLLEAFQSFGVERIEWYPRAEKGFAYAIFRRESRLRMLLNVCSRDAQGRYYFKVLECGRKRI